MRMESTGGGVGPWESDSLNGKKPQALSRYPGSQNQTRCHQAREEEHFSVCGFTAASARRQVQTKNQSCFILKRVSSSGLNLDRAMYFISATPVSSLNYAARVIMLNCFCHLLCPANCQLTFGRWETSRTLKSQVLMDAPRKWHGLFNCSSSSFSPSPTSSTTPVTILLTHTLGRAGPMAFFPLGHAAPYLSQPRPPFTCFRTSELFRLQDFLNVPWGIFLPSALTKTASHPET